MSLSRTILKPYFSVYIFLFLNILVSNLVNAQDIIEIGSFSKATTNASLPKGWEPLSIGGIERKTNYRLVKDEDIWVVRADSENAASAIFYPVTIDLKKTPIIQWRWKVNAVLKTGDATTREGDDYSGRLYILFDYDVSRLSWFERIGYEGYYELNGVYPPLASLNYLWANKLEVGSLRPNIYSDRVKMYALQSGDINAGKWVIQQRNVYADYQQAFGEEPPVILGIAIMTDTDNTGEKATAFYGDIRFLSVDD